ncbi:tetratricopeptide repeat protein [Sporosarcina thermotolerans]|uniref:tetratricopeptide repeat protein n=1 Tax=Sporosarcina thermotolerans TaxID=633404 RepID=UPI0024BC37AA|nr:tetratricopeptide repeat protein [Sporosarcina thermotolerans]WHT47619.1 tetratricopeptide repeat protein [Sporosarcina thermotolerans]
MRNRHRYGKLLKKDNVVMFPGALEQLIDKGLDAVEDTDFKGAVEAFEQVYHFDPENPRLLAPYAIALYESQNFDRAKKVATQLLHSGTTEYLYAMELYLAISIQLQHYEEVEMTIEALLDEEIVPPEMVKKFNYLRELNRRLSHRYVDHDESGDINEHFTIEQFMDLSVDEQQELLVAFENGSFDNSIKKVLAEVVQKDEIHPIVITYALVLLYESGYDEEVSVKKFGNTKKVIPSKLNLPGQDERSIEVVNRIGEIAEKDRQGCRWRSMRVSAME